MIVIDSNIWDFYFDASAKENKYVIKPLEDFLEKEEVGLNTVIVIEVAHFLIRNLGVEQGKEKVEKFLELPLIVVDLDYKLLQNSLQLFYETAYSGIGGRDSTILATLKKLKTKRLFSHDTAFQKVSWIKVFDPIPKEI